MVMMRNGLCRECSELRKGLNIYSDLSWLQLHFLGLKIDTTLLE